MCAPFRQVIEQLPKLHRALLDYLTHFLRHQLLPANQTLQPEDLGRAHHSALHSSLSNVRFIIINVL